MNNFKPKRGSSFFLKSMPRNQYAFGICLSSRSDEDDEYKIIRTDFADTPSDALKLALVHTDMFDFEDTDLYSVVEWDKDIVKSLSRKQLFGKSIEVRLLAHQGNQNAQDDEPSPFVDESVDNLFPEG
tara:strand:- start:249 stop:632 length:384 start_codon:yes stop_codon:yes gene_type:complete